MDPARARCAWTGCPAAIRFDSRFLILGSLILGSLWLTGRATQAAEPLHRRIDQTIAELHPGPAIPLCGDGEFLRRVYLDLIGRIPSAEEARDFIEDADPEKRALVIERLLASPDHDEYMAEVFDVMWMERRADKYVKGGQWQSYLLASFQQDKPLNQIAKEILEADGVDESKRGPAKFYLEREVEPNLLTREVGRMFFGMDLQCAQCHDHPTVYDYYQSDYYGLFAYVNRSYLFQPDNKKPAVLAEKAEGDAKYKSVFTDEEGSTLPKLPGAAEIDEPSFAEGEAYQVAPDPKNKSVRPVPKYSRREQLARRATDGSNRAFNRNLANRLWAHMMGRGLVHPVDQHHSANPPSHPGLLELLADELAKTDFDLEAMLRQLALSATYQRRMDLPNDPLPHGDAARQQLAVWQSRLEHATAASKDAQQRISDLEQTLEAARAELPTLAEAKLKSAEELSIRVKAKDEAAAELKAAEQALQNAQRAAGLLSDSVESASKALQLVADQTIGDSIRVLGEKRDELESQVEAMTAAMERLKTSRDESLARWNEAQRAAESTAERWQTVFDQIPRSESRLIEAKENSRFQETAIMQVREQLDRTQAVISYVDAVARRDQLTARITELASRSSGLEQTISGLRAEIDGRQTEFEDVKTALQTVHQEAKEYRNQLQVTEQATSFLAESLDKATAAAKLIADPAGLEDSIADLRSHRQTMVDQTDRLETQIAEATAKATQMEKRAGMLREELDRSTARLNAAEKEFRSARDQRSGMAKQLEQVRASIPAARQELTKAWTRQFSVAVLEPLSPEQLARSMLHATGYIDRLQQSARSAVEKKTPLSPEDQKDPAKIAAQQDEIKKQFDANVGKVVARFVNLFAAAAGTPQDDFFATVDQALFFRNGNEVRSWLNPSSGNLTDRLQKIDDPKSLADEMYLSILTRMPTPRETAEVIDYLATPDQSKTDSVTHMAWALLTSAEFRFQH